MRTIQSFAIASSLAVTLGCGATAGSVRTVRVEETRVRATSDGEGGVRVEVLSPDVLFDEGNAHLREHRCAEAVARYDLLVAEFPSSRYVSAALYNAGLCLALGRDWEGSTTRYARLLALRPGSSDEKHARLQLADGLEHLERWEPAEENAEAILRRGDLTSAERLEALARRARAVLGRGRLEEAARLAREAVRYFRTRTGDEVVHDEYFAAMAAFVLAETIRLRAEALALPEGTVLEQHDVLDRRAGLLLEAQRAYFDAIRLTDPHWAAASGYRIGAMYRAFFDAITQAPVPPPPRPMGEEQLALYRESYRSQLRDRVRPLLRHAIRYWELTLTMVERTGVETDWAARVRQDLEATRAMLQEGSSGLGASSP
jgi:tetratricopeptide (TPR) repeat protein